MNPDISTAVITLVVALGTTLNAWISIRIRLDVAQLKVWTLETFVTKDNCAVCKK